MTGDGRNAAGDSGRSDRASAIALAPLAPANGLIGIVTFSLAGQDGLDYSAVVARKQRLQYPGIICVRAYGKGAAPKFRCGDGDGVTVLNSGWIELSGLSVEGSGVSNTGATTSQGAGINFKSTWQTTRDEKLEHIVVHRVTVSGCKVGILYNIFVVGPGADFVFADQAPSALPAFRGNVYWTIGGAPFRITAQKVRICLAR